MPPLRAPSSISRCPEESRSFLLGPDGPAGAPPGHHLRSGGYMAATEARGQKQDQPIRSVNASRGTPPARPGLLGLAWSTEDGMIRLPLATYVDAAGSSHPEPETPPEAGSAAAELKSYPHCPSAGM